MLLTVQPTLASYTNLNHGFSINFSADWEQAENPDVVVLYADTDGTGSINIIVEETELSLSDYISEVKASLEYLSSYELVSERSRTIDGQNGYELVFTWTMVDNSNYYDLKDKQTFFVKDGKAFIISCGSDVSDYNSYLTTFDQAIESFSLMSPEELNQLNPSNHSSCHRLNSGADNRVGPHATQKKANTEPIWLDRARNLLSTSAAALSDIGQNRTPDYSHFFFYSAKNWPLRIRVLFEIRHA